MTRLVQRFSGIGLAVDMRRESLPHRRAGIADEEDGRGALELRPARVGMEPAAQDEAVGTESAVEIGAAPSPLVGEGWGGGHLANRST